MIDLVLQGDCEQTFGFYFDRLFLFIEGFHRDFCGAPHLGGIIDHTETAFLPNHLPLRLRQHGVDELVDLLAGILVIDIENHDTMGHAHLRRGQPDARRRVHGFEHVADQCRGFAIQVLYRRRNFLENRIRVFKDFQNRHVYENS